MSLVLRDVGYRYPGVATPTLLGIDLEINEGEVVGLLGASESGKTTLCLVASGLAPRVVGGRIRGEIVLDGERIEGGPMHRLCEHIGIGFQNPTSQLSQVAGTVFEEVAFGPMNLGAARDEVLARTWEALESLRIAELAERDPRRLSGGQQQLVAMAGLLAMRPEHLVLDEPTAQLDPAGTQLVAGAIAGLATAGASILIAEQKTDLVAAVAQRVVVLDGGRIVLAGPTDAILADPRLRDLGVAEPSRVRLSRRFADAGLDPALLEAHSGA